ncbi:MAG: BatA and WFA domain-containing protein [Chloroflexota bacterium]
MGALSSLSFLTPLALGLAALAVPIVLLYMLRLRRTETPISSTFLWQQLLRDREANAPWQRLRPSWLLLLQLLILAALVIALARPFIEVKTVSTGRTVLLLDASASMAATDVEPSRFEAARATALEMVDLLGAGDTMTVIRVAEAPEVLASASRDPLVLRAAVESAQPSQGSADWTAAMTLAAAGAVGVETLSVVILSDGGLPADLPSVPGTVRFISVGESGRNVAISALATSALPDQPPQLFARLSNYGDEDADVILDGRLNGSSVIDWAYRYTVPARGEIDIFDIELPADFDTLTTTLTLPGGSIGADFLALDNTAHTVHDRSGVGRVLLATGDNLFLRQIFRSLRGVELYEIEPGARLPQEPFDLYVLDGWVPDPLPEGDLLLVNPPVGTSFFNVGAPETAPGPLAATTDPRVRNLGAFLNAVNLLEARPLEAGSWATPLLRAGSLPVAVAGEVDQRQVAILAFDARYPNTDLVLQPAWPILIAELSAWFSPPRALDLAGSVKPGAPVTVRLIEDADAAIVVAPDGKRVHLEPQGSSAVFGGTQAPGLYRVELTRAGETVRTEQFAVNLFDPAESAIEPQDSVTIGSATLARGAREETARREFWPWIAALGLAFLLGEWLFYHRSLRRLPSVRLGGGRRGPRERLAALWRRPARPRPRSALSANQREGRRL